MARDTSDEMMELKAELQRIKNEREGKGVNTRNTYTVYGIICLGADDHETVNQAEDAVIICGNNSIAFLEPNEPYHRDLQENITTVLDDLEKFDVKVEGISKGSIKFELKCMSLAAIITLIDYFYCSTFQQRLGAIAKALTDVLKKTIYTVTFEIDGQSVKDVILALKNATDVEDKHKPNRMETTKNWTEFIQHFAGIVKTAFEKSGLIGVRNCVTENLNEWKTIPLNVAIIGSTGVGKSSFINTFLNFKADDEGAAKVDVVQCTMKPTAYSRENYPNLKIWDLPGVGTKAFPRETYLKQIEFERFDFFIILSATRFTADDIWLAKQVHGKGKEYYFVRTKIDIDIANFQVSHRYSVNVQTIKEKIQSSCKDGLAEEGLPDQNVYVVANYQPRKYDFGLLCTRLYRDAPHLKREAMALSFSVSTEGVIKAKAEVLKSRIHKVAIASGVGSAIPLPGVGLAVDIASLIEEAMYYRREFGLTDEDLKTVSEKLRVPLKDLSASLDLHSTAIVLTSKGIATFFQSMLLSEFVENIAKFGIPIIGSFIAGAASFWSTGKCLEKILNIMVDDALKINQKLKEMLNE